MQTILSYQTRSKSAENIERFTARTKEFEGSYFPYWTNEGFKLSEDIRSWETAKKIIKVILDFIRPKENYIFAIHDILGLKLQTRLRFNFIYLNEHNFNPFIPNAPIL